MVCSLIVLAVLVCHYVLPVDTEFEIVSPAGLLAVAAISFGWAIPGYASGGWKALLVAADRSQVRTRTDTIFVGAFAVWAVGWPPSWSPCCCSASGDQRLPHAAPG